MSDLPLFRQDVFDELRAELGDEDTIDVLQGFFDEAVMSLHSLSAHADSRASLKRNAHVLKGTAATFGFERLAQAAKDVELIVGAAGEPELQAAIQRLRAAFNECAAFAARELLRSKRRVNR